MRNMRNFTYDNENNILSYFRENDCLPLAFPESKELYQVYRTIKEEDLWKEWSDSSSKSDLPPDFYSEKFNSMMEVMMFDDKATLDGKRHATKKKEKRMMDELRKIRILEQFPNVEQIIINANSELPTNEDHNFKRYIGNFKRVVNKHAGKVDKYRKNHPDKKLIFFVFDESSGIYFDRTNVKTNEDRPHFYFMDEEIVNTIKKCNADYLIWFKPYNNFETENGLNTEFPKIMLYDIDKMEVETIKYMAENMVSSER